jgi:hypothetical protein
VSRGHPGGQHIGRHRDEDTVCRSGSRRSYNTYHHHRPIAAVIYRPPHRSRSFPPPRSTPVFPTLQYHRCRSHRCWRVCSLMFCTRLPCAVTHAYLPFSLLSPLLLLAPISRHGATAPAGRCRRRRRPLAARCPSYSHACPLCL